MPIKFWAVYTADIKKFGGSMLNSLGITFLGGKIKFYSVKLDILRQHKNKSIDY